MLLPRSTLRVMAANMTPPQMQPVAATIHKKLTEALKPSNLKVTNESHKHAGHSGNPSGAPDAETHFEYASFAHIYESCCRSTRLDYTSGKGAGLRVQVQCDKAEEAQSLADTRTWDLHTCPNFGADNLLHYIAMCKSSFIATASFVESHI
ncbi:hypothetical protein WJX79_004458 [Trebouxia sp. C0005]